MYRKLADSNFCSKYFQLDPFWAQIHSLSWIDRIDNHFHAEMLIDSDRVISWLVFDNNCMCNDFEAIFQKILIIHRSCINVSNSLSKVSLLGAGPFFAPLPPRPPLPLFPLTEPLTPRVPLTPPRTTLPPRLEPYPLTPPPARYPLTALWPLPRFTILPPCGLPTE